MCECVCVWDQWRADRLAHTQKLLARGSQFCYLCCFVLLCGLLLCGLNLVCQGFTCNSVSWVYPQSGRSPTTALHISCASGQKWLVVVSLGHSFVSFDKTHMRVRSLCCLGLRHQVIGGNSLRRETLHDQSCNVSPNLNLTLPVLGVFLRLLFALLNRLFVQ